MADKNLLLCLFFFYVSYDLLSALFMYKNHPKATHDYYEMVFSPTGIICLCIALIMTVLLYSNLLCMDKTG